MKVRNIMFTGFMAAILSATGAHAAISVASQAYVDNKVKANTDAITEITKDSGTIDAKVAAAVAPLATTESVTNLAGTVDTHGTDIAGLKQADIELAADIKSNSDAIALLTGGEEGEGTLQELTDKINNNAAAIEVLTADAATKDSVAYDIAEALKSYSTTEQVDAKDATTLQSAKDYADGLNTAMDTRVDTAEGKITALEGQLGEGGATAQAIAAAQGAADAAQGAADAAQDAADANTAAIEAINNVESGILAQAKADAKSQAEAAQTAAEATAAGALAGAMEDIAAAYLAKPDACATTYCVLSVTGDSVSWMPLTEPVDDYMGK